MPLRPRPSHRTLPDMPTILVVEDDPAIRDTIATALVRESWSVRQTGLVGEARRLAAGCDAAVLDVGLPDGSGLDLCRELRAAASALPILFLSARADEVDRIVGLEIGGDDYLAKPFSPRELVARLRALLRRAAPAAAPPAGRGFVLDREGQRIRWRGQALELTRQEFRLLAALIDHHGAVLTRARILDVAWDDPAGPFDRAVDARIRDLRAKLRAIDAASDPIRTVRGEGYCLEDA